MKANQLAALVLKLMGVFSLVEAIPLLVMNFSSSSFIGESAGGNKSSNATLIAWLVLPSIIRIGIGIYLLARAELLAQKLMSQELHDKTISTVSFGEVQVLAFALAGIFIFSAALPQF